MFSALTGIAAGALAVLFRWGIYAAEQLRATVLEWGHGHPAWGWAALPLLSIPLGCGVGWLAVRVAPDAPGSGIPHIEAVLRGLRDLPWRSLLPVKLVAGVLGIGAGLSLGLEGPTVQMGACAGEAVGELTGARRRTTRQLVASGAGAGLAAVFNAPLAGFIFIVEELRRPPSAATYRGSLVAVLSAVLVTRALTGQLPSFEVRGYPAPALEALPLVVIIGAVSGLLGVAFNRSLLALDRLFRGISAVPRWSQPALALAGLGLGAWWLPDALGAGHGVAQRLLSGRADPNLAALAVLLAAKFTTTVVSYGSGAPGGIFAPILVLGTITGLMLGEVGRWLVPALAPTPTAFAVLGMAAVFTASVRAVVTGIVLILEMTGNYEQLFALCVACLTSYLVAEVLRDQPIYDALRARMLARGEPRKRHAAS